MQQGQFPTMWGTNTSSAQDTFASFMPSTPMYGTGNNAPPSYSQWGAPSEDNDGEDIEEEEESDDEEDNMYKCKVCKNWLNEPRVLGCSHSFCTACLNRCLDKSPHPLQLICPTCRHIEYLNPHQGVSGLQRHYELEDAVESLKISGKGSQFPFYSSPYDDGTGFGQQQPIQITTNGSTSFVFNQATAPPYDEAQDADDNGEDDFSTSAQPQMASIPTITQNNPTNTGTVKDDEPLDDFTKFLLAEAAGKSHPVSDNPYFPTPAQQPSNLYPTIERSSSSTNTLYTSPTTTTITENKMPWYSVEYSAPHHQTQQQQQQPPPLPNRPSSTKLSTTSTVTTSQRPAPPTTTTNPVSSPMMPHQSSTQSSSSNGLQQPTTPTFPSTTTATSTTNNSNNNNNNNNNIISSSSTDVCSARLLPHNKINFAPYIRSPEFMQSAVDGWIHSLWFPPTGFFEEMKKESLKCMYVPFWFFHIEVTTQYQGQVCRLVAEKGKKDVETWHVSSGTRQGSYPNKLVCACADPGYRSLISNFQKDWKLNLIKYAPPSAEELRKKQEEEDAKSSWAGKLFRKLSAVATVGPPPHEPPPFEQLESFLKWEVIWKEFEQELVKSEEAECAGKLSRELLASKVKDVKINMTVQVNKRLVYLPTALTSYTYRDNLYKVVISGQTGEVNGDRPAYGAGKLGELGKAGLGMLSSMIWKKETKE